jgi:hypothetical protein
VGMAGYVSTDGEDDIEEAARLSVSSRHLSTARSRVHGVFTHRSHPTPKRTSTATGGAIHPLQEVACVSRVSWSEGACEVGEGAVQDHDDCVKGMCALQAVSRTQSVHSVSPAPDEGCRHHSCEAERRERGTRIGFQVFAGLWQTAAEVRFEVGHAGLASFSLLTLAASRRSAAESRRRGRRRGCGLRGGLARATRFRFRVTR